VAGLIFFSLVGLTIGIVAINSEKNAKEQERLRADANAEESNKNAEVAKKERGIGEK